MMVRLLRWELRLGIRPLAVTLGWLGAFALASLVPVLLHVPVLGDLGRATAFASVFLLVPAWLLVLAWRYWTSMYGREGYFTMSLPVRGRLLFAAKTLFAAVVGLLGGGITVVAGLGVFAATTWAQGGSVAAALHTLRESLTGVPALLWIGVLGAVLSLLVLVVDVAAVMSIGARGRWNHLGIGAPLIGLVLLYVATEIVNLVAMLWIPIGVTIGGAQPGRLVAQGMWPGFLDAVRSGGQTEVLGLGSLVAGVAMAVALTWWAVRSIERHTSLR